MASGKTIQLPRSETDSSISSLFRDSDRRKSASYSHGPEIGSLGRCYSSHGSHSVLQGINASNNLTLGTFAIGSDIEEQILPRKRSLPPVEFDDIVPPDTGQISEWMKQVVNCDSERLCNQLQAMSPARLSSFLFSTDVEGMTMLHTAARYSDVDTLRVLLKFGADVNKPGREGYTPLHLVARYSCEDGIFDVSKTTDTIPVEIKVLKESFLTHLFIEREALDQHGTRTENDS